MEKIKKMLNQIEEKSEIHNHSELGPISAQNIKGGKDYPIYNSVCLPCPPEVECINDSCDPGSTNSTCAN